MGPLRLAECSHHAGASVATREQTEEHHTEYMGLEHGQRLHSGCDGTRHAWYGASATVRSKPALLAPLAMLQGVTAH